MTSNKKRLNLYERLPEIYRIKDSEQQPPYQLKSYLKLIEQVLDNVKENIDLLYEDHFIETCSEWAIPYIGDLLGTSNLSGDPWTLRADVADTIALRRRKGTLAAIERLTYDLTGWGVHCVELRENLLWTQHLNHQRPDSGGNNQYKTKLLDMNLPKRGGTVTLRDPRIINLLNTPFDPFGHVIDLKPINFGGIKYNISNLAIFLWRLFPFQVQVSKPNILDEDIIHVNPIDPQDAKHIIHVYLHPLRNLVKLYNTKKFQLDFSTLDKVNPLAKIEDEPIQLSRVFLNRYPFSTSFSTSQFNKDDSMKTEDLFNNYLDAINADKYVSLSTFDDSIDGNPQKPTIDIKKRSIQIYVPSSEFADWSNSYKDIIIRGGNLIQWEECLVNPIKNKEIIIDPLLGRAIIGVDSPEKVNAIRDKLLLSFTYATLGDSIGSIGANPRSLTSSIPESINGEKPKTYYVDYFGKNTKPLEDTLKDIQDLQTPSVIIIKDSMKHTLDLRNICLQVDGTFNLLLNRSLYIIADKGQRPIVELASPLRFRPKLVKGQTADKQQEIDLINSNLVVHLEGIYITKSHTFQGNAIIERAALNQIEIFNCTLDPGGNLKEDKTRERIETSINLKNDYGFMDPVEIDAFSQTPTIILQRSITGPLFISNNYLLSLVDSIIDAGSGVVVDNASAVNYAVSGDFDDQENSWGAQIINLAGVTVFGKMRIESINETAKGGIWVHSLEVNNDQKGCIKFSYFNGKEKNKLPQSFGCIVEEKDTYLLKFENEIFGEPNYGQLSHSSDFQILERGPNDDAMGATGFLLEAHKWRNLQIRYREFMPIGVRQLLLPVLVMEF